MSTKASAQPHGAPCAADRAKKSSYMFGDLHLTFHSLRQCFKYIFVANHNLESYTTIFNATLSHMTPSISLFGSSPRYLGWWGAGAGRVPSCLGPH